MCHFYYSNALETDSVFCFLINMPYIELKPMSFWWQTFPDCCAFKTDNSNSIFWNILCLYWKKENAIQFSFHTNKNAWKFRAFKNKNDFVNFPKKMRVWRTTIIDLNTYVYKYFLRDIKSKKILNCKSDLCNPSEGKHCGEVYRAIHVQSYLPSPEKVANVPTKRLFSIIMMLPKDIRGREIKISSPVERRGWQILAHCLLQLPQINDNYCK